MDCCFIIEDCYRHSVTTIVDTVSLDYKMVLELAQMMVDRYCMQPGRRIDSAMGVWCIKMVQVDEG